MVAHQQSPATISQGFAFMADPLRLRRPRASTGIGCHNTDSSNSHTGMSRNTIRKGMAELDVRKKRPKAAVETRLRRDGGGCKCLSETDPESWAAGIRCL